MKCDGPRGTPWSLESFEGTWSPGSGTDRQNVGKYSEEEPTL